MKFLLDTNICVHLLRGNKAVAEAIDAAGVDNCHISEITKAELLVGQQIAIANGRKIDPSVLTRLFEILRPVAISNSIEFFAEEKVRLRALGQPLEDFDLLIGCTAVSEGMVMVSENISHMSRISGIRLENWTGM